MSDVGNNEDGVTSTHNDDITSARDDVNSDHDDANNAHDDVTSAHDDVTSAHDDVTSAPDDITSAPDDITSAHDEDVDSTHDNDVAEVSGDEVRPLSADLTMEDHQMLMGEGGNDAPSRPNTTGRMPSNLSKPRFSRASYNDDEDFSSDDEGDDDSEGVLITEIKETAEEDDLSWLLDDDKNTKKRKQMTPGSSLIYDFNEEDDGYWDTDLEDAEEKEDHDPTGRTQYTNACNRLGVVPVGYFARHLTDTEICMRYHGLGSLGTKAIAKVLRTNITLERLNLSGNWMEGDGGMYMSRMLMENDYITYLTLSENKLSLVGAHHLSKMLLTNTGLRYLDLSANEFTDESAGCIAEALEQNKYLKELLLSRNLFGVEGGEILGPAIGANDVLDHLDLSWNLIRKTGALAVAKGIKENVRLKSCDLSWNGFGPEGGAAMADAMAGNDSLQEVDISGNRLDVQSAISIAKVLRTNEELKVLRLGNNPITTAGCVALATALHESEVSTLETLDLKNVPVEYEFLRLVDDIQKKRKFSVIHGPVLRSGNTAQDIGKTAVDPLRKKDPLLILREHIVVNDTRIFDLLKKYDTEEKYSVAPEHFAAALEELGVPFNKSQLDDITKKLDKNSDGKIYYGDMLSQLEAAGGQPFNRPISSTSARSGKSSKGKGEPAVKLKMTKT